MFPRLLILLEDDACIVTTETESVTEGNTHRALLSLVEREIEVVVNFRVLVILSVVNRWGYNVILDSEDTDHRLNSTSSTE